MCGGETGEKSDVKEIQGQILEIDFQGGSIIVGDCP